MSNRPQDHWGRKARKEGFAARSVYKLDEIDRRTNLIRPGARVLDLGAFPGSWTSYAAQKVGPRGMVLGLDIQEFRGALPPHAKIRVGDVLSLDLITELENLLDRPLAINHLAPRAGDVRDSQADPGRLRTLFPDVVPVPLRDGLERTVAWTRTL